MRREYKPRTKAASTKEEKAALKKQMQEEFQKAIEPYLDEILVGGRCRQCGYVLYGLTEARCPECGTEFELELLDNLPEPGTDEGPSPYTLY